MPTAYTAMLEEDRKWDLKSWLEMDLVRAFGMFVHLRDSGGGYKTIEELKKSFDEDRRSSDHHEKGLAKSQRDLTEALSKTETQWKRELTTNKNKEIKANEKRSKEIAEKSKHYFEAMEKLRQLLGKTQSEVCTNIVKMGIEQLELCKSEYKVTWTYDEYSKHNDWKEYKDARIEKITWNVDYHARELKQEAERFSERESAYNEFVDFIEANLQ